VAKETDRIASRIATNRKPESGTKRNSLKRKLNPTNPQPEGNNRENDQSRIGRKRSNRGSSLSKIGQRPSNLGTGHGSNSQKPKILESGPDNANARRARNLASDLDRTSPRP
jgi:hypothetical protein